MIQLGLQRAAQLFRNNPQPWHAVHVAGTNGKGTVCAYLSALLHANGITCGRFTSPHLIDRWDCITINEQPVSEALFRNVEAQVLQRNHDENINATEFELLTATAFDIFTRENVDVGVVEVGMGGRDDATNILKSKVLTLITRIGLDHQAFLGNTLEEITRHKCGIFCKDVPVIYNATNDKTVVETIKEEAQKAGAQPLWPSKPMLTSQITTGTWKEFAKSLDGREQQRTAISQAWQAFEYLFQKFHPEDTELARSGKTQQHSQNAIVNLQWPGRMQRVNITSLVPHANEEVLLDGAHNAQAAENLSDVVNNELRKGKNNSISWVLASTKGRDIQDFLGPLLQPQDRVVAVEFGPVDGMPWVAPLPAADVRTAVLTAFPDMVTAECGKDLQAALRWAASQDGAIPSHVVVTGSLYLASDLLRMIRNTSRSISGGSSGN